MKKLYSILLIIITMSLLTSSTAFASNTNSKIKVIVNNKTMKLDVTPYTKGNEVIVPVKQIAESLGAKVTCDKTNNTAWINLDLMHIEIPVGKDKIYIHRDADFSGIPETVDLDTSIVIKKNTIMVPAIKFFGSIGMSVTWNHNSNTLLISSNPLSDCDLSETIPYTEISQSDIINIKTLNSWYLKNYKKSGIHYMKYKGVMYVIVSGGSKPTGGYSVNINKILFNTKNSATVTAFVKKPTPDMMVTQQITYPNILIKISGYENLKRVKGEISEVIVDTIPAKVVYNEIPADYVKGNSILMEWYNDNNRQQGISYIRDGKYVYVLLDAGEKPTGGYAVHIDDIFYSSADTVSINARVTPPGDNVRVMDVITYPSLLIRIKSDTIKTVLGDIVDTKLH